MLHVLNMKKPEYYPIREFFPTFGFFPGKFPSLIISVFSVDKCHKGSVRERKRSTKSKLADYLSLNVDVQYLAPSTLIVCGEQIFSQFRTVIIDVQEYFILVIIIIYVDFGYNWLLTLN